MKKTKSNSKISMWVAILMALMCLGVAAYFGGRIIYQQLQYKEGDDVYEQIAEIAAGDPSGDSSENNSDASSEEKESEDAGTGQSEEIHRVVDIDFEALKKVNPDVVAWLYSEDTVINYPICQGEDNAYYLRHLVDGTYNLNGCLFIDCENKKDFSDHNTIVYGHHMASGKMFASLIKYADQDYFEEHPVMYLETEDKEYKVELFSGYTTEIGSSAYMLTLADQHAYAEWLREIYAKSDFTADVVISTKDHILTLSTCAYSFQNARYVLHGKLTDITQKREVTE